MQGRGVLLAAEPARETVAEWDDVRDVMDRQTNGKQAARELLVVALADGRVQRVWADTFTPSVRALRGMVRLFWLHRDRRTGLTDGRVVQPLRGGWL